MKLVVQGAEGLRPETTGASPLSIEIRDLPSHDVLDLIIYLRTANEAGPDVEVDVRLHWTFQYEGTNPLVPERWTCG